MSTLEFHPTVPPRPERDHADGQLRVTFGAEESVIDYHVVNGQLVYGFDDPSPPERLERTMLARSPSRLLEMAKNAIAGARP